VAYQVDTVKNCSRDTRTGAGKGMARAIKSLALLGKNPGARVFRMIFR
jgi:hypothetical protein